MSTTNPPTRFQLSAPPLPIIILSGILAVFLLLFSFVFTNLDNRLRDAWLTLRLKAFNVAQFPWLNRFSGLFPAPVPPDKVVLVLVDDRSVLGVPGLFQGDRSIYADVLRLIGEGKPKAIALDIFFAGPQSDDQDRKLADAIKDLGNVVLKAYRRGDDTMTPPYPVIAVNGLVAPSYFRAQSEELIRRTSAVFRPAQGNPILSFQAETARLFWGLKPEAVAFEENQAVFSLPEGKWFLPLVDDEYFLMNFNTPLRSFFSIPFIDVYQRNIKPDIFKDRVVILGTANSMTEERFYTPIGGPEFSPYLQAMAIHNLLTRTPLLPAFSGQGLLLGFLTLLLAGFLLAPHVSPLAFLGLALIGNLGFLLVSFTSVLFFQRTIDITAAIFALTVTAVISISWKYYVELSEKMRIKNAFQHYVTASVVNEILKDPSKLNLHGEERNLTIFFSDIEGFTPLCEGMPPMEVVKLLNEYLTFMTEIIFKYDGLLDKYEGDAIMSVFGAPVDQKDHAIRACKCAIENQKVLTNLREKWRQEGKPVIKARIGINTGVVVVGNMGSKMRFDYTVIGDNVNLAARMETANKMFNTEILLSGNTAELVEGAIFTRCMGTIKVLGRKQSVAVYEVLGCISQMDTAELERANKAKVAYEKALELALKRVFEPALQILDAYLKERPDDRPAALLRSRCRSFLTCPPPTDWDGTMVQEQK